MLISDCNGGGRGHAHGVFSPPCAAACPTQSPLSVLPSITCSAGLEASSSTLFLSHIAPAPAYSHQSCNSIFLSHHSSSNLQLQPAERSEYHIIIILVRRVTPTSFHCRILQIVWARKPNLAIKGLHFSLPRGPKRGGNTDTVIIL